MTPLVVFLTGLLILAAVVAACAIVRTAKERIASVGLARLVGRWFLGHPWHGGHVTDAGWNREGKRALNRVGHARRFWHRKGRHRAAIRTTETLAPVLILFGLVAYRTITGYVLGAAAAAGMAYGAWRAWQAWRRRVFRRSWVYPLHKVLAPMLNVPLPNRPESWLQVAPDKSWARLALPVGYRGQRDMDRIADAVTATLALESPDVKWDRSGARPVVEFTASATPSRVGLDNISQAIGEAGADELVLGLGKRGQPVTVDLHADSPHLALSMATGAGKTRTARLIAAQVMTKGGLAVILNVKRIGYSWARGLPNAAEAKTPEQIAALLGWLEAEMARRADVADLAADHEDHISADVGPRILVVAEELNLTLGALRREYPEAIESLAALFYAGRQVRINVLAIAQRLSARASGGGDARENVGTRILGRYQPQTWRMLAGEFPMPEPDDRPGRVQVVTSRVHECQVADLTGAAARRLASAGTVTGCPSSMPVRTPLTPVSPAALGTAPPAGTGAMTPVSGSPGSPPAIDGMSLREIASLAVVPMGHAALKTARRRYKDFPAPVGYDSQTALYDPELVAAWHAGRRT